MQQRKHYVIGDVHGEYEMLLALVAKLPKDANLIFVGDLINRGAKSRQVIEFVQKNALTVVMGNHETYMMNASIRFFESIEVYRKDASQNKWIYLSGTEVLQSYGLLSEEIDDEIYLIDDAVMIKQLKKDLKWINSLALYYELESIEGYDLPIVVSHGSIGDYWHLRNSDMKSFRYFCHAHRLPPSKEAPIFNIYGHKIVPNVLIGENFASIDTGCGKDFEGAKLSAYCVETREVFEVLK